MATVPGCGFYPPDYDPGRVPNFYPMDRKMEQSFSVPGVTVLHFEGVYPETMSEGIADISPCFNGGLPADVPIQMSVSDGQNTSTYTIQPGEGVCSPYEPRSVPSFSIRFVNRTVSLIFSGNVNTIKYGSMIVHAFGYRD